MTDKKKEKKININIKEEVAAGHYSNLFMSNYSKEEFILDFAFIQPQIDKADVKSRVILTPRNAKRLADILNKNIADYEKQCGPITDTPNPPGMTLSFN